MPKTNLKKIKIVFWGNPPYAKIVLDELLKKGLSFEGIIYTERKFKTFNRLTAEHKIKNLTSLFFNNKKALLKNLGQVDLCILANFGYFIPEKFLSAPKYGFLNIHPSLLPRHRGPAPVPAEILAGDKEGGVTVIKMDDKIDHGPIIGQTADIITQKETIQKIYTRRFKKGAILLKDLLPKYITGEIKPKKQNEKKATKHGLIKKEDGLIDLNKNFSAKDINRKIRAYYPWPTAYLKWTNKKGKIYTIQLIEAEVEIKKNDLNILYSYKDRIFVVLNKSLYLNCKNPDNLLRITKLKVENKNVIDAKNFINGYLKNYQ